MDKEKLEQTFRKGGTVPVLREPLGDFDLFVSDGFSKPPHLSYQKMGVQPDQYPSGAHVTWVWLGKGEKLLVGTFEFYDVLKLTSQPQRIAAAKAFAQGWLKSMTKEKARNGAN